MRRSYTRYNTLNEDARRQQLRSNLRASNRIVEDEEEDLDDIEIEADAIDSEEMDTDEDFKQKLIDLFNQAQAEGILTIDDLTGASDDGEDEEEDDEEESEDEDFDIEESAKAKARAKRIAEARARIAARNKRKMNEARKVAVRRPVGRRVR